MSDELRDSALEYHRLPSPGKISVTPTKPLGTQRDLALAYSPGVAAACEEIVRDADTASEVTARGNLVAVVTNGTAVLGLGNIGPLAAKPVMEGKGVLFKKFAGIDVFDMEIAENDADKLVDIIASMEPTFGAINLEDIKAPECFEVERKLKERMGIPVMHDDQHGTAIVVGAAMVNALRIVGKDIGKVKLVASGAGAAALACINLLVSLGVKRENIWVTDIKGVVYKGRNELMDPYKEVFAQETEARTLDDVIGGADIFLGLSAPRVLTGDMVAKMADQPIVFALANPTPEILPEEVKAVRKDAIIATGRSDYPNQVNNVLVFPYIFRGALDVGATQINEEMKLAATYALAELAMAESDERVRAAYGEQPLSFGPEYLIPKPFDSRLILKIAPAVARAAMSSGVARRPIIDFQSYLERLSQWVFRSGLVMKPVFDRAKQDMRRVVFCEGEQSRVLLAVQGVVDEGIAFPILIGRREVVTKRIKDLDLRLRFDEDFELVDPQDDPRYNDYWRNYHALMERKGVSPDYARTVVRTRNTVIGTLMVRRREADSMICGTIGRYDKHLEHIVDVIGIKDSVKVPAAMNLLIMPQGTFFICDTYVTADPTPEQIVENTLLAAEEVRRFGIEPKVAFLSHSNFGARDTSSAQKMRAAIALLHERAPYLEADGEMHGDAALEEDIRARIFPNSRLKGQANLLIMPNLDAANISFNLLKVLGEGLSVGPILMGAALPAHILTPSATVRNIVNMTALAAVDAQMAAHQRG
ncbi:NADP-dependent malic enzyme [Magnetospirillum sp. 64-120]|uniref:NADP-dependent malic enzyme n=1 Tax=Magnetospirillum sp. 64-120 TaxID=1895778 RepID=UPI0009263CE7|nr:NADP-dependent malic enzyme [Magnetospirillum sp. 64-120]OJX68683.1 MAG: NADP-dependent malic enzyme [Magnetospirillum sp. 64-120]